MLGTGCTGCSTLAVGTVPTLAEKHTRLGPKNEGFAQCSKANLVQIHSIGTVTKNITPNRIMHSTTDVKFCTTW